MFKSILKLFGVKPKTSYTQTVTREPNPAPQPEKKAPANPTDPLTAYLQWRKVIFSVSPETGGVTPGEDEQVYGVVMDLALADDKNGYRPMAENLVISITAFASIESSLRTSFGGGIIGIGTNEQVAEQIRKIIPNAQNLLPMTQFVEDSELPKSGDVYFYFLTTKGRRFSQVTLRELMYTRHSLSELFSYFSNIKGVADKLMTQGK